MDIGKNSQAARRQASPLDTESKCRLLVMYTLLEKKRQSPQSAESVIQGLQEMGEEAQRNGLIPEILDDILNCSPCGSAAGVARSGCR